jgi:sugar O-acyltransferase (sialic acid O-acetyltransferase NeuD family)
MKKKLILYGASNFGDEIVQLFRDIDLSKGGNEWEITGFLDDDPVRTGLIRNGVPVLGTGAWIENNPTQEFHFICVVGNPSARSKIVRRMKDGKLRFASGIHPSVIMSDTSSIGEGVVVTAGNIITTNVSIGDHVIVNLACTIGHFSSIGPFCTLNPGVNVSGDVTLEEGVLLGTNSTVLEKVRIGAFSIVGAGAMVNRAIPPGVTAVGVPAKPIQGR